MTIRTSLNTPHLSEHTREALRTLLEPTVLRKGDGDFEIGREVTKRDIKEAIEAHTGIKL